MVGACYFDGWAGKHRLADTEVWAKDAPTHLTERMLDEFPDREPIWGWRDDRQDVMEQQIDLAADHGIAFFAFCWYRHPTQGLNQKAGWHFPDCTPTAFGQFVQSAIDWMDKHPEQTTKERPVLVYAWNEFGEGGYVAPTKGDPEGQYLKALRSVVLGERRTSASADAGSACTMLHGIRWK